jgi:hypothetical protein
VLNASRARAAVSLPAADLSWPEGQAVREALSGRTLAVAQGQVGLALAAHQGALLVPA